MVELLYPYRWQLSAVVSLMITGYALFCLIIPGGVAVAEIYEHNRMQEEKIQSAKNWKATLATYQQEQQKLEAFYDKLFVGHAGGEDISAKVQLIVSGAGEARVNVKRITPLNTEERDNLTVQPVSVTVSGRFHRIAHFINGLQSANHLIRLRKMKLGVSDVDNSSELLGEIHLEFVIIKPG